MEKRGLSCVTVAHGLGVPRHALQVVVEHDERMKGVQPALLFLVITLGNDLEHGARLFAAIIISDGTLGLKRLS